MLNLYLRTHINTTEESSRLKLQCLDLVCLVVVPSFDPCLCFIWWLCVVMPILLLCLSVIVLITHQRVERKMPPTLLKCFRREWMNLTPRADKDVYFWQSSKCSEGRPNSVSNLSKGIMLSWWGACPVPLLQWPVNSEAYSGKRSWMFHFKWCYANIYSVPCFENLQIVQCVWIRCNPQNPCTIHDSGISNEQWKKYWSFERGRNKVCLLDICSPLSVPSKEGSFSNCSQSLFCISGQQCKAALEVKDIESNQFRKAVYCLLRAVFSALMLLRYCDENKPAMDKIYYLCDCAEKALPRSNSLLSDYSLFGFFEEEFTEGVDE